MWWSCVIKELHNKDTGIKPSCGLLFCLHFSWVVLMLQGLIALSVWFILEEGKRACQSASYAYKVARFFIKDYTNKTLLRAWEQRRCWRLRSCTPLTPGITQRGAVICVSYHYRGRSRFSVKAGGFMISESLALWSNREKGGHWKCL